MRLYVEKREITSCIQCGHFKRTHWVVGGKVIEGYCSNLKRDITRPWQTPKDCPLEKVLGANKQ